VTVSIWENPADIHMSSHMNSHSYLGSSFEVWPNQQTWLWFVVSPLGGGTIGASTTEAQAIADACAAINEAQTPTAEPCGGDGAMAAMRWNETLASLDCYLRGCRAGA
jgi:hypothetical protein